MWGVGVLDLLFKNPIRTFEGARAFWKLRADFLSPRGCRETSSHGQKLLVFSWNTHVLLVF